MPEIARTNTVLHQAGAIAYRVDHGRVEILLITSRDTGRWIIPKGNIGAAATPASAAAKEAYEEAGIRGAITSSTPLGFYTYFKRLSLERTLATTVEVYTLLVTKQLKNWPEKGERKLAWLSAEEAIEMIDEPGMTPLLRRFAEVQDLLGNAATVRPAESVSPPHRTKEVRRGR